MKKRISLSQKKLINPQHLNLKQLFSSFKLTKSKKEISEIKKKRKINLIIQIFLLMIFLLEKYQN